MYKQQFISKMYCVMWLFMKLIKINTSFIKQLFRYNNSYESVSRCEQIYIYFHWTKP